jgi:diketogulonate reductase-like aldo/keto reductase
MSMAQAAVQWAARQPAVGSVILGARTLQQFEDNLGALDVMLPDEAMRALDEVSAPPLQFPYSFFAQDQQAQVHGGAAVGDKPDGYHAPVRIAAAATAGFGR